MSAPIDPLFVAFQEAVAGRYSLDRELGRGGMGVVYLAREVHLDRPVAIKLLPPERASQRTLKDRFLREARLAAKLSHPNIIPIHSVEDIGGFVFFVMSFVDGETLANRVRTRGPLPSHEGTRVLREVAWALAYAHEQGLVHRDVKPDNILLEESTGRVMVADFGIAAAANESTGDGISGTPEFMSPEQALGTALDARSDLYSLGATAYYAFSGKFPFEGKTATEVLAKQVTSPAPPLSSLGLSVPRRMAALIDRCLAKAPENRPESATALAEQLGVALERRRELPAALRAFVKNSSRLNGPGTLLTAGFMSTLTVIGGALLVGMGPNGVSLSILGMAVTLIATAPFVALVDAASTVVKKGFTHRDIGPAFDAIMEQEKEEFSLVNTGGSARAERVLAALALSGWAAGGAFILAQSSHVIRDIVVNVLPRPSGLVLEAIGGMGLALGMLAGIGWLILRTRRAEPESDFWYRIWKGRIGQKAFAVAAKWYGSGQMSALTHRATELSLGMAAEQLYDSLPKDTRRQLGDVPGTLRQLQDAAQELRKRHESLVEALSDAGDAGSGADYAEVREMRDSLHDSLREAVGALETIRLNLLRLHAGSISAASVTTQLGRAADIADEVDRLIAAQGEVERTLKFPRTPATTPV